MERYTEDFLKHAYVRCARCEKKYEDGGGICKFRLTAGLPAYMLPEIITGPVVDKEE